MTFFCTFNFILAKIRKSIRNNFCYVFVQMSGKYKKYLTHIGTPANVQNNSGVTLLFEHLPSRASEIEHFEVFSCPRESQLARQFFVRFNLLLLVLIS